MSLLKGSINGPPEYIQQRNSSKTPRLAPKPEAFEYVFSIILNGVEGFLNNSETSIFILKLFPDEDNAETASIAVECFDEQNTEDFHPELQSCKGIEEVNSQTMKEWYCSHTPEEIHSVRL
ncbi:hypothetical protein CDAR_566941 [Caerostris darwini]|uniref:Uncharacterized protein n=1 Tax=Caerostris darwini TaxID=1538125 RepID=A0AAV4TK54_9ARAC|nr:hypothetical protein CDAR_566941 [Caerostris darwini]